jgi:HSP20 family protein
MHKHSHKQHLPVTWQDLDNELERLLGLWPLKKHLWLHKEAAFAFPKIDVKEESHRYLIIADLPGMDPKNLKIEIDNELLTISGSRQEEHESKEKKGFIRIERSTGSFSRQVYLPNATDAEQASADYENGTLTISVPKRKTSNGKKINITHKKKQK